MYQQVFGSLRLVTVIVDYEQPPVNFEQYNEADRHKIMARMQAIQAERL